MSTSRTGTARRSAFVTAALLASAFVGCSKPAEEPSPAPAPAAAPEAPAGAPWYAKGGGGAFGGGGGGGGGGSAKREDPAPPEIPKDLELRVLLRNRVVARGEPIPAMIEIVNISKDPLTIVDGRADLALRTKFLVRRGDKYVPAGPGLPAGNSVSRKQDVVLPAGQGISAEVDILPTLEDTLAYVEGRIRFVLEYQGDAALAKSGTHGWNTDPMKKAVSKQFDIEVTLPDWLIDLGGNDATYVDMSNAAATFQPGVPGADAAAAAVQKRGAPALGCLLLLTRGIGGMDPAAAEAGRRALALLRTIGEPAFTALSQASPGDDPAMQMTLGVLVADHDERSGIPPDHEVDKALRAVGGGGDDSGMFDIRFTGTKSVEPGSWSLSGSGVLALERGAGDDTKRRYVQLPAELLAQLKKALFASRFSAWRHCRRIELADEGSVTFAVFRGDRQVRLVTLSEQEAFHENPLSAALIDTFRQVAVSPQMPTK